MKKPPTKKFDPDAPTCPNCHSSWVGDPIPEEYRKSYGNITHFHRLRGIEVYGKYDGIGEWQCPDCFARWDRFTGKRIE